jgi:putative oxidoreductase
MAAKVIALALRLIVAAVFLTAGVLKIWDFKHGGSATSLFYEDIISYDLVSSDFAMMIAVYLPWLEVVTGLALLGPWLRLGALTISALMTVVFLGALGSAWWRGLDITCGCFGKEVNQTDFPVLIARDVALLGAILYLLWRERTHARSSRTEEAVVASA